jgi:Rrf2 family protein
MKLTSQEEYGLRCILTLARHEAASSAASPSIAATDHGVPVGDAKTADSVAPNSRTTALTVSEIAEIEGLSIQYAGKLTRILARAGLLESVRGRKGGYRLSRPSHEVSVSEILTALGGKIYESGTCERFSGDRQFCVHTNDCSVRSLWAGIQTMIDMVLTRTTLFDLVGKERTMSQWVDANVEVMATFDLGDVTKSS